MEYVGGNIVINLTDGWELIDDDESVKIQDVTCIHVDWKPPAGGNEKLLAILSKLQQQT